MRGATITAVDSESIVAYVERCQVEDGAFFFARVPPGCASDTYHAVAALNLLGRQPAEPQRVRDWLLRFGHEAAPQDPRTTFYLTQTGLALGLDLGVLRQWARGLYAWRNQNGGFGSDQRLWVEVPSELESTYFAVKSLVDLGMELGPAVAPVREYIQAHCNSDGGYGAGGRSTVSSTYYALATLAALGAPAGAPNTVAWLHQRERYDLSAGRLHTEVIYWLAGSAWILGEPLSSHDYLRTFLIACQRPSGGFARSPGAIATLEDTHYALQSLCWMEALQ